MPCRATVAKAKAAYQDFLTLWNDADLDIPVLKQAKAEYGEAAIAGKSPALSLAAFRWFM
jgi:hypothetical protein